MTVYFQHRLAKIVCIRCTCILM